MMTMICYPVIYHHLLSFLAGTGRGDSVKHNTFIREGKVLMGFEICETSGKSTSGRLQVEETTSKCVRDNGNYFLFCFISLFCAVFLSHDWRRLCIYVKTTN